MYDQARRRRRRLRRSICHSDGTVSGVHLPMKVFAERRHRDAARTHTIALTHIWFDESFAAANDKRETNSTNRRPDPRPAWIQLTEYYTVMSHCRKLYLCMESAFRKSAPFFRGPASAREI